MKTLLWISFLVHDQLSLLLVKQLFRIKKILLVVAHFSLLGLLVPAVWREYGGLAGNLLIFILFLSPLAKITRMRLLNQLMSLRRELGILMGYLALAHGVGYLSSPDWATTIFPIFPVQSLWGYESVYFYGILALLCTLPLLITSNNFAQKRLGGVRWKLLHRLVYGAFIFAILHRFFQREDIFSLIQAVFLVGGYALLKLYAWKPFLPVVNEKLALIGAQYKVFTLEKSQKIEYTSKVNQ